jgi:hypothetical protein
MVFVMPLRSHDSQAHNPHLTAGYAPEPRDVLAIGHADVSAAQALSAGSTPA